MRAERPIATVVLYFNSRKCVFAWCLCGFLPRQIRELEANVVVDAGALKPEEMQVTALPSVFSIVDEGQG